MIQNRIGGCNDIFQDVGISSYTDINDACCATWNTKEIVQLVQLAVLWILWLYVTPRSGSCLLNIWNLQGLSVQVPLFNSWLCTILVLNLSIFISIRLMIA